MKLAIGVAASAALNTDSSPHLFEEAAAAAPTGRLPGHQAAPRSCGTSRTAARCASLAGWQQFLLSSWGSSPAGAGKAGHCHGCHAHKGTRDSTRQRHQNCQPK